MSVTLKEIVIIVLAVLTWFVGAIVWAMRLEGRLNLVERLIQDEIRAGQVSRHEVMAKLELIEGTLTAIRLTCAAFNHLPPKEHIPAERR